MEQLNTTAVANTTAASAAIASVEEYTVDQAAAILQIGSKSIKDLIRMGLLRAHDISNSARKRRWIIEGASLQAYATSRRIPVTVVSTPAGMRLSRTQLGKDISTRRNFSTGQVARVCNVAARTVTKWIDSGRLKGWRIPGSNDRRVEREDLVQFLTHHGIPLGELEQHSAVLLVGCDDTFRAAIYPLLGSRPVLHAPDWLAAGLLIERYHPAVVVADMASGRSACLAASRALRGSNGNGKFADVRLVGLVTADEVNADELRAAGWDVVAWEMTARVEEVAKVVLGCVGVGA